MCAIRRRQELPSAGSGTPAEGPDEIGLAFPSLWEYLVTPSYEDGKPRQLPTLMVFYDHPLVKVCLNDRDQGLSCWVSATGLQGAFLALERGLAGDCLEWRKPGPGGRKKR